MTIASAVGRGTEIEVVAEHLRNQQSVLLAGEAGVGKSYLAAAVAESLDGATWKIVRLAGGPAIQTVHLGAAQPLLSLSMARTPDELFANVEHELRRDAGTSTVLLVVDDFNQVDPASAGLLYQLCRAGITMLATVRDDGVADPSVMAMWSEGLLERIDIGSLAAADSNVLVDRLLGGVADPEVHRSVYALAQGNPLFTRELIADARSSGVLAAEADTWRITGSLRAEQRVSDLFAARLAVLDEAHRHALELIALAEPVAVGVAQQVSTAVIVEELEASELISLVDGQVRCSHPMLGEVTRREVPSLRKERLIGALIDAIVTSPQSSASDVLRAVRWQLERNETPAPLTAAAAAQTALAIFDGSTAVQCAQAAFDPTSAMSHVLLGRAQFIAQDPQTAVTTLQNGSALATTDAERAMTAVALGEVLAFGTGDFVGASTTLEDALVAVDEPQHRAMIAGSLSLARGLVGDFDPALKYGDELLELPELDAMARMNLLVMWTIGAVWTGRLEQTQERLDAARELADELRAAMPTARDQILITQSLFDLTDGRLSDALDRGLRERESAEREHRSTGIWDHGLALVQSTAGRGAAARAHSERAVSATAKSDPLGLAPFVFALEALVAALTGDLSGASAAHDRSIADPRSGTREQPFLARATANVMALQGDIDAGVEALFAGIAKAGDGQVLSAWALYDAVRFDRADKVLGAMQVLATEAPVESVLAMTDHCEALVAGDATRLAKAAERLGRAGFMLFAAEAATHASRQLGSDGDETGAALMALRALAFFDRCDSLRSLAIESLERPLTDREYEVARAAAAERASQDIADELFVSRRTVDNHLQNAYRKLGINQRDELTRVFTIKQG